MNQSSGSCSSFLNEEAQQIEIYASIAYAGSFEMQEEDDYLPTGFEIAATTNMLASILNKAASWLKMIKTLDNPEINC